jgi:hypothetical protein
LPHIESDVLQANRSSHPSWRVVVRSSDVSRTNKDRDTILFLTKMGRGVDRSLCTSPEEAPIVSAIVAKALRATRFVALV